MAQALSMNFSIIIPTLNESEGIKRCLLALQTLRGEECEIIVADGGSTDRTRELADPLCDKLAMAETGRARQMNAGAELSEGDILVFLHADTYLPENALALIRQRIGASHPWGRFDIRLIGSPKMLRVIAFMMNGRSRLTGVATGDQCLFITREVFFAIGKYPDIALMEDIALSKRLNKICRPICLTEKVSSSGRKWERQGVAKTILLMWWLRIRYFFGSNPEILAKIYYHGERWTR